MKKLLTASVAAFALMLGACAQTPSGTTTTTIPPINLSQIQPISASAASDLQILAGGLPAVLNAAQATGKLSATQAAKIQKDVTLAQSSAQALANMPSIASNAAALTAFEGAVQDALAVANTVAPTNVYVQAATVVAPLAGILVNTVVSQVQAATSTPAATATATPAAPVAAAPLPQMSADTARMLLKSAAGK